MRITYGIIGALIGAATDVTIAILAVAVQQRTFGDQFTGRGLLLLIGLVIVGVVLGIWLGGEVRVRPTALQAQPRKVQSKAKLATTPVTITRLRALLSYGKLRGQGITLSDILLIGSPLDIDSRE